MKLLCRLLGHKVPKGKPHYVIAGRYQRCERCGAKVPVRDH